MPGHVGVSPGTTTLLLAGPCFPMGEDKPDGGVWPWRHNCPQCAKPAAPAAAAPKAAPAAPPPIENRQLSVYWPYARDQQLRAPQLLGADGSAQHQVGMVVGFLAGLGGVLLLAAKMKKGR